MELDFEFEEPESPDLVLENKGMESTEYLAGEINRKFYEVSNKFYEE